jgi:lipoprotein-releasing system permease protein
MNRWTPFELVAALRFMREGYLQTLFITIGISIGVAVIIFLSAMLVGLQTNFIKRVLTSQPHIQMLAPDEVARPLRHRKGVFEFAAIQRPAQRVLSIDQWPKIVAEMQAMPEITAISPTVSGSALAQRGDASRAVTLTGMVPDLYYKIVRLPDYLVDGSSALASDNIIIGTELAKDLGVSLKDKVILSAASGARVVLTVVGIFDMGNKGVNERNVYVPLRTAQSLLNLIGGVTTIDMRVADVYAAERIAQSLRTAIPVQVDSWIVTNAQFFTAIRAQDSSNTIIRLFVGLSVAFGIAAVLVVSVIQRSKEIGILRAMGTTRGQILRVFLIQGGVLGAAGSILGSAMGVGALVFWHSFARQADGSELFPLIIDPRLFLVATVVAAATGVLAAMAPAMRAARLDPVVAIRG